MVNLDNICITAKTSWEPISVHWCFCLCLLCFFCSGCSPPDDEMQNKKIKAASTLSGDQLPKVVLVNSYHFHYPWTNGITRSIAAWFKVPLSQEGMVLTSPDSLVNLKIIDMDTKRNTDKSFVKTAALHAKQVIERWQPDLIITSDDNAVKYLVVPYYKNTDIPVVFCGVNWSAAEYGLSGSNVTGMVEVQLVDQILDIIKRYAQGDRVAFLKGDDNSARKEALFFEEHLGIELDKRFVASFSLWKEQYLLLQDEADMILIGNSAALEDWDDLEAQQLVTQHTVVPSGNWDLWMAPYALVTLATKPEEQGEWSAEKALQILQGASPGSIELAYNKVARVYLNMKLARKLGITFPLPLVNQAVLVE